MSDQRYLCHFSCGIASAVATKLTLAEQPAPNVRIIYLDTGSEHPDNRRFLADCQRWFDHPIEVHKHHRFADIWEVFEKERYLAGPAGARCTALLKRHVAERLIDYGPDQQIEVFGYTAEERPRVERFRAHNTERRIDPILVRRGLGKRECFELVQRAGIEVPAMYKLGYNNNNCIGCVKGGQGYWNKIRVDFPEVFERMARMERHLGAAVCKSYAGDGKRKRVFLDELDPDAGRAVPLPPMSCGMMCDG